MPSPCDNPPTKPPAQDKYSKLLRHLKNKTYERFAKFIKAHEVNVDHEYGSPDNGTLLEIACRSTGNSKFIETLIQHNARINSINKTFGKAPIHDVVQNDDYETLCVLLQSAKCDPHIQDKYGNCVLHYAAVRKNVPIVRILKQYLDLDIVAWKLVDRALVDFVSYHTSDQMRNELRCLLEHNTTKKLFRLLYKRQSDPFIERIQKLREGMGAEFLYDNDGYNSYMQYACKAGLSDVVVTLLSLQIDPNHYCSRNPMNPIMISAFQGYYRILEVLLSHSDICLKPIEQHTVLHCLFYGMFANRNTEPVDDEPYNHLVCLNYLYKKAIQGNLLDVNSPDEKGYTALHYAVQLNLPDAIMLLIDAGADVCQKNCNGQTPLGLINASTLEEYLDNCISFNDVHYGDQNHIVIFRYNIFTARVRKSSRNSTQATEADLHRKNEIQNRGSEIGPLVYMTKANELKNLLKHPVVMSFVTLKWHAVKKFFFVNAIFYFAFALTVSSYLCVANPGSDKNSAELNQSIRVLENVIEKFPKSVKSHHFKVDYLEDAHKFLNITLDRLKDINNTDSNVDRNSPLGVSVAKFTLLFFALLLFSLLCCRELLQISVSPRYYIKSPENWLIMVSIILTGITLTTVPFGNHFSYCAVAPIAIFIIWLEFVLLLGRYPALSTNHEIFKRFSYSLLKFMHWFSLLIFAYLISLYVRFHRHTYHHFRQLFVDPFVSVVQLFKTSSGGITDLLMKDITQIIYLGILLCLAIIVCNLVNALAVADTQQVRSEAELLEIIARIKFISHLETIAFAVPDSYRRFFNKLVCGNKKGQNCVENFYRVLNLFPYIFADRTVHVSPNIGNQVLYVTTDENSPNVGPYMVLSRWKIDSRTVKNAMKIYQKHFERNYSDKNYDGVVAELTKQTRTYQERIDKMEKQIDRLLADNTQVQTLQDQNNQLLKEITDRLKSKS